MSPSFLTSVLALVGPGRAGLAQLQEKGQLEEAPHAQIRDWLCCHPTGSGKAVAKRSPEPRAGSQSGRCLSPRVSLQGALAVAPAGPGQEGGSGCRAGPPGEKSPCSRDTMGSELQVHSRSVKGGQKDIWRTRG